MISYLSLTHTTQNLLYILQKYLLCSEAEKRSNNTKTLPNIFPATAAGRLTHKIIERALMLTIKCPTDPELFLTHTYWSTYVVRRHGTCEQRNGLVKRLTNNSYSI